MSRSFKNEHSKPPGMKQDDADAREQMTANERTVMPRMEDELVDAVVRRVVFGYDDLPDKVKTGVRSAYRQGREDGGEAASKIADTVAREALAVADSEYVTAEGKTLHEAMGMGASNAATRIRHQLVSA